MTKSLKNLLILLMLSVISASAQDSVNGTDCNTQLNTCIEECGETDETCMDKCDLKYPCPEEEEEEEVSPES